MRFLLTRMTRMAYGSLVPNEPATPEPIEDETTAPERPRSMRELVYGDDYLADDAEFRETLRRDEEGRR